MKCPKCGYIGFETGDRCRNCGYDFSLSVERSEPPDLSIRSAAEPLGPLADLKLAEPDAPRPEARPSLGALDLDRIIGAPPGPTPDLPLFDAGSVDERPLVAPSVPRAPLAVRRSTPETPKLRARPERSDTPTLDLQPPARVMPQAAGAASHAPRGEDAIAGEPAGAVRRLAAAAIDLVILGAIHAAVLYFTLRLGQLQFTEVPRLPWLPLGAFLLLLSAGYVVVFTAVGGQTIGKMAVGLRVTSGGGTVDVAHALLRFVGIAVTWLTLGLGYLPALFGESRRALHDRLAGTDVVRQPDPG